MKPSSQEKSRVYKKNFANFEQAIQKQLNDDFQVHEYLNDNKLKGDNIGDYIKLYNGLLVQRTSKKKVIEKLNINLRNLQSGNIDHEQGWLKTSHRICSGQVSQGKNSFLSKFQQSQYEQSESIQIRTINELQVKKNLWNQIRQTKKSLSLLKGDIGHLVRRNQSANLLSSKINKVKIVVDDQLKRVNMAFGKDKDEIKLRNQMQKKFHFKMKNLSIFEDISLKKMKKNYIELMQRKKDLFQRLAQIDKISTSIAQHGDLQKQAKLKNFTSLRTIYTLKNLCQIIGKYSFVENEVIIALLDMFSPEGRRNNIISSHRFSEQQSYSIEEIKQQLENLMKTNQVFRETEPYTSKQLEQASDGYLQQIQKMITREYKNLNIKIQQKCFIYNECLKKIEQIWSVLQQYRNEEEELMKKFAENNFQFLKQNQVNREDYEAILKKFTKNLKNIFKLLAFINTRNHSRLDCNYASTFHQLYRKLNGLDEPFERYDQEISYLDNLAEKSQATFNSFNQNVKAMLLITFSNKSTYKPQQKILARIETNIQQKIPNPDELSQIPKDQSSRSSQLEQTDEFQISNKDLRKSTKQFVSCHLPHQRFKQIKAKRIQLLEDMDQNYYKMLKNTLKMEKENTRKNYEFLKTFKRGKYVSRDEILEEKRFQSSFSVLMTVHKDNIYKQTSTPSHGFRGVNEQSRKSTAKSSFYNNIRKSSRVDPSEYKRRKTKLSQKLKIFLEEDSGLNC